MCEGDLNVEVAVSPSHVGLAHVPETGPTTVQPHQKQRLASTIQLDHHDTTTPAYRRLPDPGLLTSTGTGHYCHDDATTRKSHPAK